MRKYARKYAIVIERGPSSFGASVPDLPGCVAVGRSRREVLRLIRGAIEFHIEGLRARGEPVPEPTTTCDTVEV